MTSGKTVTIRSKRTFEQKCLQLASERSVDVVRQILNLGRQLIPRFGSGVCKTSFAKLKSGGERFVAIGVGRSESLRLVHVYLW